MAGVTDNYDIEDAKAALAVFYRRVFDLERLSALREAKLRTLGAEVERLRAFEAEVERLRAFEAEVERLRGFEAEAIALRATKTFRWMSPPRNAYARARRLLGR